jgi:4-diphosphocytidyl-2-C-methyl-D-erythritol kinase
MDMAVTVRSFAKINLGLTIGAARLDGFHALETIYQTVAAHDLITVEAVAGDRIVIRCQDARVPCDATNTCYRMVERALAVLGCRRQVTITIDKRLPVQGGLGAGSSNAVAALFGLERVMEEELTPKDRLRVAAEVGSDVPLFLLGGTVLGVGRGEQVYPLPELPGLACVLVTPNLAVSTPKAFRDWDELLAANGGLTCSRGSATLNEFSLSSFEWLSHLNATGVPAIKGGDRAETPLLDLVRAGIENDFERVVFPQYPELRDVKRMLEREGAGYASLSGSGSTMYGLFASLALAEQAAAKLTASGLAARATQTLTRQQYGEQRFAG